MVGRRRHLLLEGEGRQVVPAVPLPKELFEQLVESVKQMKAIEAGEMKPARVTRAAAIPR